MNSASVSLADSSIRFGCAQPHILVSSLAAAILSGIRSFTGLPSTNSADCTSGESTSTLAAEVLMTLHRNSIVCSPLSVSLRELASFWFGDALADAGTIHPVGRITIGLLACIVYYLAICVSSG